MNTLTVFALATLICFSQARPQDELMYDNEETREIVEWLSEFVYEMMVTIDTYLAPLYHELEDSRRRLQMDSGDNNNTGSLNGVTPPTGQS
ncbi:unnamed protein product [Diatraea saccharalis]|uniref:Secreted protein n=1 Tax=Diatraea saccharalis TaxID=40085 RepID=A0A9N9WD74_9NEOP|nr:unnamed protein product [Diatraea saccharalis]